MSPNEITFDEITKEAVIQALQYIDQHGVPQNAHSTTYDILYNNKRYPPKLTMQYAYKYTHGTEIGRENFHGGDKTPCFSRLRELGFTIILKNSNIEFYNTLIKFIAQAKTNNLKTQDYVKEMQGLTIKISFGLGNMAKISWISFLYKGQTTNNGEFIGYLYFKEFDTLFLTYGISETTYPNLHWKFDTTPAPETVSNFFMKKGIKPDQYGSSHIFKSYDVNNLNPETINKDLYDIIQQYKDYMHTYSETTAHNMKSPIKEIDYQSIPADLRPYITAIKAKPFVLLAGISGTGKSRIVRQLAYATSGESQENTQKPFNFEMIPVRPNWHDSSELLGYLTRVSGTPEYIVPDFLKFVAKAWVYEDIPFFLCLDEMNLAPVEQYFAEYLSVVESRKLRDGKIVTDPLIPALTTWNKADKAGKEISVSDQILKELFHDFWTHEGWSDSTIATQIDKLKKQFREQGISIPQNLIVMGTVNMDETTYSFSRKVLDRAMTIEMNDVDLAAGLSKKENAQPIIPAKALLPDAVEGYDIYEDNKDICDSVIGYLKQINEKLKDTPFKIAYRTRNEFLLYVLANLPYQGDGTTEKCIARALDEITCMKILSRIEGDKNKIGTILDDLYEVVLKRTEVNGISPEESVSLYKIRRMKKKLDTAYYCDFWS